MRDEMKKRFCWVVAAASIEAVQGPAVWITDSSGMHHATPGMTIAEGASVRTEGPSSAEIRLANGSRLALARATEARFFAPFDHVTYLELHTGEVLASLRTTAEDLVLPKGQRTPPFVLRAPGFALGFSAADFSLRVDASGDGVVSVLQGSVAVSSRESDIVSGKGGMLPAGQELEISDGHYGYSEPFSSKDHLKDLSKDQQEMALLVTSDAAFFAPPPPRPGGPSAADADGSEDLGPRFRPMRFQFAGMYLVSLLAESVKVPSMEVSWNPSYRLFKPLDLAFQVAVFPYFSSTSDVPIAEAAAQLALRLGPVSIEGGGGYQSWFSPISKSAPVLLADVGYALDPKGMVERVFLGVSDWLNPGAGVAELRLGVGLRF